MKILIEALISKGLDDESKGGQGPLKGGGGTLMVKSNKKSKF